MKYRDRIVEQQKPLSPKIKQEIFFRFEHKKRKHTLISRVVRYAKMGVFSFFLLVVVGGVFIMGSQFSGRVPSTTETVHDGFVAVDIDSSHQVVYANQMGQILESSGDIVISHDGKEIDGNILSQSDKIVLLDDSLLTFLLLDGTKARIEGPAEFSLEKVSSGDTMQYVLNLFHGDVVELISLDEEETQELLGEISIGQTETESKNNKESGSSNDSSVESIKTENKSVQSSRRSEKRIDEKIQIVVKTPDLEVMTEQGDENVSLVIKKNKEGEHEVTNEGSNVIITKIIKNEKIVTELSSTPKEDVPTGENEVMIDGVVPSQPVVIGDEDIVVSEQEAKDVVDTLLNKDLTITYEIEDTPNSLKDTEIAQQDKNTIEDQKDSNLSDISSTLELDEKNTDDKQQPSGESIQQEQQIGVIKQGEDVLSGSLGLGGGVEKKTQSSVISDNKLPNNYDTTIEGGEQIPKEEITNPLIQDQQLQKNEPIDSEEKEVNKEISPSQDQDVEGDKSVKDVSENKVDFSVTKEKTYEFHSSPILEELLEKEVDNSPTEQYNTVVGGEYTVGVDLGTSVEGCVLPSEDVVDPIEEDY